MYHLISRCTVHGRRIIDEIIFCWLCFRDYVYVCPEKIYTRKELVIMDTSIADFNTSF